MPLDPNPQTGIYGDPLAEIGGHRSPGRWRHRSARPAPSRLAVVMAAALAVALPISIIMLAHDMAAERAPAPTVSTAPPAWPASPVPVSTAPLWRPPPSP